MYTGTFTYMPADKTWIYDPKNIPFHNGPAHNQFEVNLVSWRLSVSEVELTNDYTENLMVIDGHALPCYFADGFCKPITKTLFTLVWFSDDFCLIFTLQDFAGRLTEIDYRYRIETDSLTLHYQIKRKLLLEYKALLFHIFMHLIHIIELDPDTKDQDFYILRPEPIKRKPPLMFTPNQIKTAIRPITFTAQDAGIISKNTELDQLWNRILFSKHSDKTLQLLGKALSYSFVSSNTPDYSDAHISQTNPYNTLGIGLHDKLLNLTPLFTPSWFADAFITLFDYPCYIFTQCGIYFSTFLFIQALLTLLSKFTKQSPLNIV